MKQRAVGPIAMALLASPLVVILLLQYIAVPLVRTIFAGIATGVWSL